MTCESFEVSQVLDDINDGRTELLMNVVLSDTCVLTTDRLY
jgi:hypothetical protein